jgi:hypothetical protein
MFEKKLIFSVVLDLIRKSDFNVMVDELPHLKGEESAQGEYMHRVQKIF